LTIEPWLIERSEYVLSDQRMRVRADECRRSDGVRIGPIYVIEAPIDAVNVLAVTREHEVILVREYHHATRIVGLGIVGGGIEPDETPEDAVRRELLEETGYVPGEIRPLGTTYMNWRTHTNRVHHFVALDCRLTGAQSLDEFEEIEVVLTSLDAFDPMVLQQTYHLANALLAIPHLAALARG
jgi:ADP-ribose pyrophosphatase